PGRAAGAAPYGRGARARRSARPGRRRAARSRERPAGRRAARRELRLQRLPLGRQQPYGRAGLGQSLRQHADAQRRFDREGRRGVPRHGHSRAGRAGAAGLRAGRHAVVRREVATAGARRARRLHPKPGAGGPVMFKIEYATQRLALPFFVLMGVLFLIQAGFGFLLALEHNDPALLQGSINFSVARAAHLNLAVLWIIAGFVGTLLWTLPL